MTVRRKIAIWAAPAYSKGVIFDENGPLNRDNCLAGFRELKRLIELKGGDCRTHDGFIARDEAPEAVLFLDVPAQPVAALLGKRWERVYKCLMLQEPPAIIARNWDASLHAQFDRILTWNDSLVDNKRYFKFNYANSLGGLLPADLPSKSKMCVVIAGNRASSYPGELYSKRIEAVRWFEANHPEDFDLYGRGWDEYTFRGPRVWRAFNRLKFLRKALGPKFPSYKGEATSKTDILKRYRFSICYENSCDMPGYISEKIFDCFRAGCLPVYWGAPNIGDHIPGECFLDKREFSGYGALYSRMAAMTDAEYLARMAAVRSFISGERGRKFSVECFAETIAGSLMGEI